jgi:hypothetical protein
VRTMITGQSDPFADRLRLLVLDFVGWPGLDGSPGDLSGAQ